MLKSDEWIREMAGKGMIEPFADEGVREGVISAEDPLMEPKFYVSPRIEAWIEDYLREVCAQHPNWNVAFGLA